MDVTLNFKIYKWTQILKKIQLLQRTEVIDLGSGPKKSAGLYMFCAL